MKYFACLLLLLLPAVCLAQAPEACTPNACGPVQAIPPLPQPHFQPAPQPHFEPPHDWHGDHHDGDFHGGWHGDYAPGPHYDVNPWNFVAPIITNFATAPRMVVNPLTGQPQLMSPGQWILVNAGTPAQTYTWQPLPVWPLGNEKPKAKAEKPARIRPLRRLVIHLHLL